MRRRTSKHVRSVVDQTEKFYKQMMSIAQVAMQTGFDSEAPETMASDQLLNALGKVEAGRDAALIAAGAAKPVGMDREVKTANEMRTDLDHMLFLLEKEARERLL